MRFPLKFTIIISLMVFFSCGESGSSYEQVTALKTVSERVQDLNKSTADIKQLEEKAALSKQDDDFLEYEYPVREDEMYVVSYRFDDAGCFEIGIDVYFNEEQEAQNVVDGIIKDISSNTSFNTPEKETSIYRWKTTDSKTLVELDFQHVERGMLAITIFANE